MSSASTLLTHYGDRYRQVARTRPRLKGPRLRQLLRSGFELWASDQFFNWGEPLLNTHLEDFISLANSKNVLSAISTNLSLQLSDDRIRRLVTSGLREMIVSLDGASSETYQVYRRRGKFDLVCENMRRMLDTKRRLGSRSPLVTWQFLIFRFNEHEVEKARTLAAEIGVDGIPFRPAFLDVDRYHAVHGSRPHRKRWPAGGRVSRRKGAPAETLPVPAVPSSNEVLSKTANGG